MTTVHPHDSLIKSRRCCTNNAKKKRGKKVNIKYNKPEIKVFNTNFCTFLRDRYNKLTKHTDNDAPHRVPESGDNIIVVMYWVLSCKLYVFDIINNILRIV